ncbi:MAG TPA: hypothetical protein DHV17_06775 [Chitinophagaceae bacterium]|nr:hypothetical protein [Chitinophagaceae bacterium]
MNEHEQHCKSCGQLFQGKFCPNCGEKVLHEHDKSVWHFFEEAIHFLTHFEGTFFATLRAIFFHPGKLSKDYCAGIRRKYFKPLPFFMLLVFLYLLFPLFKGLNMQFMFYLKKGNEASRLVSERTSVNVDSLLHFADTKASGVVFEDDLDRSYYHARLRDSLFNANPALSSLSDEFNRKSEKTSKLLLLILIPLSAIPLWLMQGKKRKYLFDHMVLATELNAYLIITGFFIFPLLLLALIWLFPGFRILQSETFIGFVVYFVFFIFCFRSFRNFYQNGYLWALLKAMAFCLLHIVIMFVIYKAILFYTTFYLI